MAEHDNGYEAETLAPFNAAVATIIATRCLNVRELDVVGADVSFYDKLVHLLDENLLRIESLTALNPRGRYDVAWMPVFEALRDQSSGVSRYVKRLNVNNSMTSYKRHKPEIDALLAMLSVNTTLQSVVPISELPSEVRDQFKALPRQFVLLPSSPSRQRALISAIQNAKLPHLSAEALQSVFEYAGRTRRRYVL